MTTLTAVVKSLVGAMAEEPPAPAAVAKTIRRDARADEARVTATAKTVADDIAREAAFVAASESYAVLRSRFCVGLVFLPLVALLTLASWRFTLFGLEMIPDERVRNVAALALVGATLMSIHLLLDSLKRSHWVIFALAAVSVAMLGMAHYQLADARAAVIADWILNAGAVIEAAPALPVEQADQTALTLTLLPLLEALLPLVALGLEIMAGVGLYYALAAIVDPSLLAYARLGRLRRKAARLEARALAARSLAEDADEIAQLTISVGKGTQSLVSKEAIVAIAIAIVAILALSTNLFAASAPEAAGACAAETRRVALLIDLSKSRTPEDVAADVSSVSRLLAAAQPCTRYVVMGIGDDGWGAPIVLLDSTVVTTGGWMNQGLAAVRRRLTTTWAKAGAALGPAYAGSDVIGTLLYAVELLGVTKDQPGTVLAFTDGRQTRYINLESGTLDPESAVRRARDAGLVPDLAGSRLYVVGASTAGKSAAYWASLRDFWKAWTAATGATLGAYSIGRDVCRGTSLCTAGPRDGAAEAPGETLSSGTLSSRAAAAPPAARGTAAPGTTADSRPPRPAARTTTVSCTALAGAVGSSLQWGAGWLDLNGPTDFRAGDTLRLGIGGTARRIVVRLLARGDDPNSAGGVDGGALDVPARRMVTLTLGRDHRGVRQISAHGGTSPWGLYRLGGGNGPAALQSIERCSSSDGGAR